MLQARAFPSNCEEFREIQTTGDAEDANNFFLESWETRKNPEMFFPRPQCKWNFSHTFFKDGNVCLVMSVHWDFRPALIRMKDFLREVHVCTKYLPTSFSTDCFL